MTEPGTAGPAEIDLLRQLAARALLAGQLDVALTAAALLARLTIRQAAPAAPEDRR